MIRQHTCPANFGMFCLCRVLPSKGRPCVLDQSDLEESDTGLSPPSQWDLEGDKQMMKQEMGHTDWNWEKAIVIGLEGS